jgi:hypothetical protein
VQRNANWLDVGKAWLLLLLVVAVLLGIGVMLSGVEQSIEWVRATRMFLFE